MAKRYKHRIVETPIEVRQALRGLGMLAMLAMSGGMAVLILGAL
jgi:hypothetical protein